MSDDEQPAPATDRDIMRERMAKARAARKSGPRTAKPRTRADAAIGVSEHPEPAANSAPPRESYAGSVKEEEVFTRRRRDQRGAGGVEIPAHRRRSGWDYQFITITVLNQPVDGATIRDFRDGGWRPVLTKDMPELADTNAPPDAPIETGGWRLYTRPMHLTIEARQEDYEVAQTQRQDRMLAAASGKSAIRGEETISGLRGVRAVPGQIGVEELAG